MFLRPQLPRKLLALVLLCASSPVIGASTQQDATLDEESPRVKLRGVDFQNIERVLRGREREYLHPTVPLNLVGSEEGDNDFRKATPLLEGADTSDRLVDVDEIYRRRIAMYDAGPTYGKPLPSSSVSHSGSATSTGNQSNGVPAESHEAIAENGWRFSIIFWLALGVLAATLGWKRRYYLIP